MGSVVALMRILSLFHLSSCFLSFPKERRPPPQAFHFSLFSCSLRQDKMSFTESARFVLPNSCSRVWSFMLLHPPRTHSQLEFQQHCLVIKDLDCGVETARVQVPDQCFICPQAVAPLSFSFLSCEMSMVMVCMLLEK